MKKNESHSISRRKFVKMGSLGMLTMGMVACSDSDDLDEVTPPAAPDPNTVSVEPSFFPQSIATGDPRPDSLIFWTRVFDAANTGDLSVRLVVGLDPELTNVIVSADLTALAEFDHVVKIKLMQLTPYTTYYYQFQYGTAGSVVGRTKTAPTPDQDVSVRYAFISCQDYRDRFYNTLADLSKRDDLDFVVHLGDYIYETTSGQGGIIEDPDSGAIRGVEFSDPDSAIPVGTGDSLAANSLSNYRDLYKFFKSDEALQAVHERNPMIAIWDDHEFSNDSHRENGTYFNGLTSEASVERKVNSEQVYAEYMPLDFGLNANGELVNGADGFYPNTRIYRDFHYGRHLHLLMTDTRSFRPDHPLAEDAWPGTILLDEATVTQALATQGIPFSALRGSFASYVNIDDAAMAPYKQVLTGVLVQGMVAEGLDQATAAGLAAGHVTGNVSIFVANSMIDLYNASNPPQPLPQLTETADTPRGLAVWMIGKQSLFSSMGTRNLLIKDTYDLYTAVLFQATGGASEDLLGSTQESWLINSLTNSEATWRVLGSSIPMAHMVSDVSSLPVPAALKQPFYVGADHWSGFPNKRNQLLAQLGQKENTVIIAGDLHSSHVTEFDEGPVEFAVTSVSSQTMKGLIGEVLSEPPFDQVSGAEAILEGLERFLHIGAPRKSDGSPMLKYTRTDTNGYAIMEVDGSSLRCYFHHLSEEHVQTKLYSSASLGSLFNRFGYELRGGALRPLS